MELTKVIYTLTDKFPKDEKFGIISQMWRSSISIFSNIAEGAGRESKKEFCHFLSISNGSSYELQTQLIVAEDIEIVAPEKIKQAIDLIDEIQKMNFALRKKLLD